MTVILLAVRSFTGEIYGCVCQDCLHSVKKRKLLYLAEK